MDRRADSVKPVYPLSNSAVGKGMGFENIRLHMWFDKVKYTINN